MASIGLRVGTASAGILPELPEARTPVTLLAATDPGYGKSEFRYRSNNTPPVIRVQPGSVLTVEYKNELAARSREECLGQPCMNMSNLHFHGLHVSPNTPQDDVLTMMAAPGQALHYSVQVPPQQPPGLYWYRTHSHGESYIQDLDGMSGAIVESVPLIRHSKKGSLIMISRSEFWSPAIKGSAFTAAARGRRVHADSATFAVRTEMPQSNCGL